MISTKSKHWSSFKGAVLFGAPFLFALGILGASSTNAQVPAGMDVQQLTQQLQQGRTQANLPIQGLQPDMGTQVYAAVPPKIPAPPSRLEQILSARAGARLTQFGYDNLGRAQSIAITQTGAVQDDYLLGPGDQLIVSLRGQENNDFRATVDRNGQVLLPRLKPLSAMGRSLENFRQDLEAAVRRAYVATDVVASVASVRQVSVFVTGEVNNPGQHVLGGLSSVIDALALSGGVRKSGSLRNIHIQRAGRDQIVDLYDVLASSGSPPSLRLADGDRIVVPPLGATVAVTGLVRRPGIYELSSRASGMTVRTLVALAGGKEVRGRYRLNVQRISPDGQIKLVTIGDENQVIGDSEILRVELDANQPMAAATLSGGVSLAGQFAVGQSTKLSEILKAPGALGASPYTLFGIIVRKDQNTLLRTPVVFTPVAVLRGAEDMQLQSDDLVRPISVQESALLRYVVQTYLSRLSRAQNQLRNPTLNSSLTDLTRNEENFYGQEDFSAVPPDMQRSIILEIMDNPAPGSSEALLREQAYQQSLLTATGGVPNPTPAQMSQAKDAAKISSVTGIPLQAPTSSGQAIGLQAPTNPAATSSSSSSAVQAQTDSSVPSLTEKAPKPAANFQEQPTVVGEFASNQEVGTFGELSRQLEVDPLVLINFLIENRAQIDGAVRGPGAYLVGRNASLADLVQAAGGTLGWADESGVELLTTAVDVAGGKSQSQRMTLPLRQGTLANYIIRPHDQIQFRKVFTQSNIGTVTIQGEVRYAGTYSIRRGDRMSDLLLRAGGLTSTAYPSGAVFLRKSAAEVERQGYQRVADEIQSQLISGMARVGNDKINGEAFTAVQSFVTQLRSQRPLGRVAVSADPSLLAANPNQDIALEAGDTVFVPARPSTISVLGEVMQPGSISYRPGMTAEDYIKKAGGFAQFSNEDMMFIVEPDGSAHRAQTSWLSFSSEKIVPGSTIVVPRDIAPLYARQMVLDVTGIMSQLAVTIASLAVLAKQ